MRIEVWTDGSSHKNGKPDCIAGWSAVFMMGKKTYIRYGHLEAPSSNNRGEIFGVLYTLSSFQARKNWELEFHSDSQYVVKSINEWRRKWKLHNYVGIKNEDLFVPLFNMWDERGNAEISWVRGHIGVRGNELADEYAGMGTRKQNVRVVNDAYDISFIDSRDVLTKLGV